MKRFLSFFIFCLLFSCVEDFSDEILLQKSVVFNSLLIKVNEPDTVIISFNSAYFNYVGYEDSFDDKPILELKPILEDEFKKLKKEKLQDELVINENLIGDNFYLQGIDTCFALNNSGRNLGNDQYGFEFLGVYPELHFSAIARNSVAEHLSFSDFILFNHLTNQFTSFIAVGTDWRIENPVFAPTHEFLMCYSNGQYDNESFIRIFQYNPENIKNSFKEYTKADLVGIITSVFWVADNWLVIETSDRKNSENKQYFSCQIK